MLLTAAAAPAPVLDPTLLALLSIFGGALLTAAAGLIGSRLQARRDHRRWLNEERFQAYLTFLGAGAQVLDALTAIEEFSEQVRRREVDGDERIEAMTALKDRVLSDPSSVDAEAVRAELGEHVAAVEQIKLEMKRDQERMKKRVAGLHDLQATLAERSTAFDLLGPQAVSIAAVEVYRSADARTLRGNLEVARHLMRDALNIDY